MAFYTNAAGVPAAIIYTNFEREKQAKSLVINLSNPLFSDLAFYYLTAETAKFAEFVFCIFSAVSVACPP